MAAGQPLEHSAQLVEEHSPAAYIDPTPQPDIGNKGCIYWEICPPPPSWQGEISAVSFEGKNMKRGIRKSEKI
jgi:hypothetical protein